MLEPLNVHRLTYTLDGFITYAKSSYRDMWQAKTHAHSILYVKPYVITILNVVKS